ncbi:clustered mitochondria-domain-containing protein [Limtongia smithiae]|uniref:clustered mitochondria-domain-containing protein n=1 Tax=Limtongia smithiae TaxID=1125753 RepID=UPI0034CD563C
MAEAVRDVAVPNGEVPGDEQPLLETLTLNVKLPRHPFSIKIVVSIRETFNDIRQSILDLPSTIQYTCFSLWFDGAKLNDFLELSSVEGIHDGATLELHEEAYNEREARAHFLKVRDIMGLASTKNYPIAALSSGLSALESLETKTQAFQKKSAAVAHPMVDFALTGMPVLQEVLPAPEPAKPQLVKSLSLSHWHPPPPNLRLRGHLLYLQVLTLEGYAHHITADVSGFYVSNSSNQKFDPSPRAAVGKSYRAHSLLVLLQELSTLFTEGLLSWQTELGKRDPLTIYTPTNALLASPWLSRPAPPPVADVSRTQEQYLLGGSDNLDTVRDWNEDLQSTREMPRDTIQERVLRERLLNKLYFDFAEAAAKGAVLIAHDEIPALNPNETRDAQIFLYNGIFFSYGADGIGTFAKEGGDPAARYAVGKDLSGVKFVTQLDVEGICPLCTVIIDYCGRRIVAQSPVPGIFRQREDGTNQIVYGGVDGRDTIANDPSFRPMFEKIAESLHLKPHTVWDKDGNPKDLVTSVELKGLNGTDGRKYIIDLYRIAPLDVEFLETYGDKYPHKMTVLRTEAVEEWWKEQVRKWITERSEKLKAEGKEAKIVYKPLSTEAQPDTKESDEASTEEKTVDEAKVGETTKDEEPKPEVETIEISGHMFSLNPDVYSGQQPVTEDDQKTYAADEADVRQVSQFLLSTVIPGMVNDIRSGVVSVPLDSKQLTKLFHKRGINMRYISKVIEAVNNVEEETKTGKLSLFRVLLKTEIILRSAKHVINKLIKSLPAPIVTHAFAHIFNSLIGMKYNAEPTSEVDPTIIALYSSSEEDTVFKFTKLSAKDIQAAIADEASLRFFYSLEESWVDTIRPIQLFRELSLKFGLQWRSKQYLFEKPVEENNSTPPEAVRAPVEIKPNGAHKTNGKANGSAFKHGKKSKAGKKEAAVVAPVVLAQPSLPKVTFMPEDLLNIMPVMKDSTMRSLIADEAMEAGRVSIMQGDKDLGVELLLEALSLHEQIYGIIHPEVARAYSQLSMIYGGLEEKVISAELARKATIIAERTLGLDDAETVLMYLNLALTEHANGNSLLGLMYVRRACTLWRIVCGDGHPDNVNTMNNAAVMLQAVKEYHDSRKWFEMSLEQCEEIFGAHSLNAATLYFQLAQALVLTQDSKQAVTKMREAYTIFHSELGPDDKNTKESEVWLERLTHSAVNHARQARELQNRKVRKPQSAGSGNSSTSTPLDSATAVGSAAAASARKGGASVTEVIPTALNTKSVEELVKYINN